MARPKVVIFNSKALYEQQVDEFEKLLPSALLTVVHNGVNLDKFTPRVSTDSDNLTVAIVANLNPVKGHEDFLKMAAILTKSRRNLRFLVIGDDLESSGYSDSLVSLSEDLGLGDKVRFLGHVENVPEALKEVDIVVCSSYVEPFGRCVIEAMSSQIPVVATAVGGLPEVVADGKTGFLVEPGDPVELANRIGVLAENFELRRSMGIAGRNRAEQLFGSANHARSVHAIYQDLVSH